jgi:tRNA(adenine34) deaminase
MCSGALYWSKIGRVIYGAPDEKNGYRHCTGNHNPFHPKTIVTAGLLGEDCGQLMKDFFRQKRK